MSKRSVWRSSTFLAFLFWLSTSFVSATEPTDIHELNGKLGRGINLGNYLEPPRNANWSVKIVEDHLGLIKQAGFQSIRLPVKWSDYALDHAPYTIEPDFFRRIDGLLNRAEKEGLRVVLNIHHYDGLDSDPESHVERFVALWKQIATRYKDRGDWLYFELNNEPHDQLNERWNDVLVLGLIAVRESNPTRAVIVGPPFWNGIWALQHLKLPKDDHLIVTVHMYNPFEFTHQGASWVDPKIQAIRGRTWGTDEEMDALRKELDQAATWGKEHHVPIYLGEFGAFSAAPMDSRVRWTTAIAREAEKRDMSWAYWEFASGFSAYDLEQKQWRKELLKALIP